MFRGVTIDWGVILSIAIGALVACAGAFIAIAVWIKSELDKQSSRTDALRHEVSEIRTEITVLKDRQDRMPPGSRFNTEENKNS